MVFFQALENMIEYPNIEEINMEFMDKKLELILSYPSLSFYDCSDYFRHGIYKVKSISFIKVDPTLTNGN